MNGVHTNGVNGTQLPQRNGSNSKLRRKDSIPLAPPFIVSAPGKTIVYGEHAVVHGKAAIAASISLRSYLLVTTLSKSKTTVTLNFADIGLDHTWNIPDLPWKAFAHPARKRKYYDMVTSLDPELVEAMQPHIAEVSADEKPDRRKIHQAAASSFLYLFLSLGSEHSPACVYALRSTIPVGVGLGSSASVTVCLSAALLVQCRALAGPHADQISDEASEQLERINRWAFVGEMLIHGNPSGVDNTVATNGHAVLFERKDYSKPPAVRILRDFPELPLLLIDTCQPKSTAAEVAKVGRLKAAHPAVVGHVLDAIDAITRAVHARISDPAFDPASADSIAHLGELMAVNHGLLAGLGVSHPKLEQVRALVEDAGVGWTKLTGAGGGGCAITLLRPEHASAAAAATGARKDDSSDDDDDVDDDDDDGAKATTKSTTTATTTTQNSKASAALASLEAQLDAHGFVKYEATLGGDGVGVLYPAVIHGEDIDLEMFLTAEGREGVEALVGGRSEGDGWKYWRP